MSSLWEQLLREVAAAHDGFRPLPAAFQANRRSTKPTWICRWRERERVVVAVVVANGIYFSSARGEVFAKVSDKEPLPDDVSWLNVSEDSSLRLMDVREFAGSARAFAGRGYCLLARTADPRKG